MEELLLWEDQIAVAADAKALEVLQAVYRSPRMPLNTRIRAAALALPFESPKLAVTAIVQDKDFASILEARIKHWRSLEQTKLVEQKVEKPRPDPPPTPKHPPTVPDRRFRRI